MSSLVPPTALFRFRLPCYRLAAAPKKWSHAVLTPDYALPNLSSLDGRPSFADVRMAWTAEWIIWQVSVRGKQQPVWGRSGNLEASDGLRVWIDSRDTKQVQRPTRFCHQFVFLPDAHGNRSGALGVQVWMESAKGAPRVVDDESLRCHARILKSGYDMVSAVATDAITGLDQVTGARLGFFYEVLDSELGVQTLSLPREYGRYDQDPSLWGSVELTDQLPPSKSA